MKLDVKIKHKVHTASVLGDDLEGHSVGVQVALNLKFPQLS